MRIFNVSEDDEKTNQPRYINIYDKLIKNRIVFLSEEIDSNIASTIVGVLLMLNEENKKDPITFYINCPGGSVEASFAIYDIMQLIEAPVKTICCGEASSFGALLLAAGSKGMRYATPNSRVMIHQIQIEGGVEGRGTDIEVEAKEIKAIKKRMTEVLARHTGQTYRKVYRDCEVDKYMTAQEAHAYGIVDDVLPPSKQLPELKTRKRPKKKANPNT